MRFLSLIVLFFLSKMETYSQDQLIRQNSIAIILEARSLDFQVSKNFNHIKVNEIETFIECSNKKHFLARKKKNAIRIIENNLYVLNNLIYWESELKAASAQISPPELQNSNLLYNSKNKLIDVISSKRTFLLEIKKIEGLRSFEQNRVYLGQFIEESLKFDEEILEYIFYLINNSESNLIKYSIYQSEKQLAEIQIDKLEADIYKRMILLNYDLEKFYQKKYFKITY